MKMKKIISARSKEKTEKRVSVKRCTKSVTIHQGKNL